MVAVASRHKNKTKQRKPKHMSQRAEAKEGKEQVTLAIGVAWRSETGDRVRDSAASTASE